MECGNCLYVTSPEEAKPSPEKCPFCGLPYALSQAWRDASSSVTTEIRANPSRTWAKNRLLRKAAFCACVVLLLGSAYRLVTFQAASSELEQLVRLTTAQLSELAQARAAGSSITLQEILDKNTKAIQDVDSYILKAQVVRGAADRREDAVVYMRAGQETARGISSFVKGIVSNSVASARMLRAARRLADTDGGYGYDFARQAFNAARQSQDEAKQEYAQAVDLMTKNLALLKSASARLDWVEDDSLPSAEIYKALD